MDNDALESHGPLHNGSTVFDERAITVGACVLSRIALDALNV